MTLPPPADFIAIEKAVDAACDAAKACKLDCCANLADLHCCSVSWCLYYAADGTPECHWLGYVGEASPEETTLIRFIRQHLIDAGIKDHVEIHTEW